MARFRHVGAALLVGFTWSTGTLVGQELRPAVPGIDFAERWAVPGLEDRRFGHQTLWDAIGPHLESDRVRAVELGRSIEGRPIRAVVVGHGPTTVLLWSQMHGDESTASMSLADIIRWWADSPGDDSLRRYLADRLTITMVPMLNPDGAERFIRHNAAGVDVNRDARRLATPEGRILKTLRDSIGADFGFNLHDQGSRTAGADGDLVAIALLAPAADAPRSWGPVRQKARRVAAVVAEALDSEIPGRMARYDDAFTPRAFGDNMQAWGTATVLIESGALRDDPQKQRLRKLNVVALLAAFLEIAAASDETLRSASTRAYDELPMNVGITNDILLTGGHVVVAGRDPLRLDVAVVFDDAVARTGPRYGEVGDLAGVRALEVIDADGLFLHVETGELKYLRRGAPARIVLRRGVTPDAAVVRVID